MSEQHNLFDDDAKAARDAALAQVEGNASDWMTRARQAILQHVPPGWTGTAEDVRVLLTSKGLPAPHHHNAWGALILSARGGLLKRTGEWRSMKTTKSHARQTPVYVRCG